MTDVYILSLAEWLTTPKLQKGGEDLEEEDEEEDEEEEGACREEETVTPRTHRFPPQPFENESNTF